MAMPREEDGNSVFAEVWCDVGGTFTDCFVKMSSGELLRTKVLSHGRMPGRIVAWSGYQSFVDTKRTEDPSHFWVGVLVHLLDEHGVRLGTTTCTSFDASTGTITLDRGDEVIRRAVAYELDPGIEAPVLAARWLLHVPVSHPLPNVTVKLGTTRGTNALLTRTGARTVFATTRGFGDLLEIGYQERPELFALLVEKRLPLYDQVLEVEERLDSSGNTLVPLDREKTREDLSRWYQQGYRSLAICLLHSYRNPLHEQSVADIARQVGFETVAISSDIAPVIRAVSRAETTVVDAYLTPVVRSYLERVKSQFQIQGRSSLRVMTSSGGLVDATLVHGRNMVLSGPAGGAVALEALAQIHGFDKLIGLDMGGTSTDVCRVDGRLQLDHETVKAGARMVVPTLAIHTVAAGGGSVCWFDGVQLRVGPHSAGADPGPACYGRGGPLTITDLNLLTGRIDPSRFPIPMNLQAAKKRVEELLDQVRVQSWFHDIDASGLVRGLRRIANEQMAAAVRAISIQQGADPREHVLVGFGGAAGQHICELAEILGMTRVLDHPDAGLLSALGMGLAQIKRTKCVPVYRTVDGVDWTDLSRQRDQLQSALIQEMHEEGFSVDGLDFRFEVALRYAGTEGTMRLSWNGSDPDQLRTAFDAEHLRTYGYARKDRSMELVELCCEVASTRADLFNLLGQAAFSDELLSTNDSLEIGSCIHGPKLLQRTGSTTFIDEGWTATVMKDRSLLIQRIKQADAPKWNDARSETDPILREVVAQRIAAIAEQMGIVLEQTAISVNVKQRRDFSCAVFNSGGELIANAPHVPVHLGAMGATVQAMIHHFPVMKPGDSFVTNDPYCGGSHLPDITVVTPVFAKNNSIECDNERPQFFVASRAHHAEIGGISPGSMAPTSTRLGEEGVLIPLMYLTRSDTEGSADEGMPDEGMPDIEHLLLSSPFPSRSVAENMADLAAQRAANLRGLQAMQELGEWFGYERLASYMSSILDAAEAKTRRWIATLEDRVWSRADSMDDGSRIQVQLRKCTHKGLPHLEIDFTGTGPECTGNLNANPGIVTAAVMYCVRCAIDDSMPLNSGVLRAIGITIPEGILNPKGKGPKSEWPAVAGGNVETSQRVVDCILGALELAAASQGTMNNFLFGDHTFGYYETIGGGTGATPYGPGADAVHSHMTNTRLTDVEVLESRYPVRLERFSVRRGSGGAGLYSGGSGMVRQIVALRPIEVSLVTSRRGPFAPFGLAGGQHGALGRNWKIERDGTEIPLPASCQVSLQAGEGILIETPGGGGYGEDN